MRTNQRPRQRREHGRFVLPVLMFTAAALAPALLGNPDEAQAIMRKVLQNTQRQEAALCSYAVQRTYTLENNHLSQKAKMIFALSYKRDEGKHFKLLSEEHTNTIVRHAILDYIDAEPTGGRNGNESSQFDETNYRFVLGGREQMNGHLCYRIHFVPKRKSKYLLVGDAWVDTSEFAMVRMKGEPAKSISFWVGHSDFEQDFNPLQNLWMPSYNRSFAHVKFVGDTILTIEYSGYRLHTCSMNPTRASAGDLN